MPSVFVYILYSEKDLLPYQILVKFLFRRPIVLSKAKLNANHVTGFTILILMQNVISNISLTDPCRLFV